MNNSYNFSDFVGTSLLDDDEYDSYGHEAGLQLYDNSRDPVFDINIENMLLNHSKYHIYCE